MDDLSQEAERLYNMVKRYAKTNPTPQNEELEQMARTLYDDFRGIHNPRMLEKQAKTIKEFLYHGLGPDCMLTTHCTELKHDYEQLRLEIRKHW